MHNWNRSGIIVSIIIPTYNRIEKTRRAIDSCLEQTYTDIQVVVINDGGNSTDFMNLKSSYEKDSRIEFLSIQHTGHPGKVRNVGIQHSSGQWIAFLDSDDYWESKKLEVQLNHAYETGSDAICSNAFKAGSLEMLFSDRFSRILTTNDLLTRNLIVSSSVLIDRLVLLKSGGVVEKGNVLGSEDFATWLRVSTSTNWHFISEALLQYEMRSSDSLRFSKEVSQLFSKTYGLLDFIEWKKSIDYKSIRLTRILIEFIPIILKLELFINRARMRGKKSSRAE